MIAGASRSLSNALVEGVGKTAGRVLGHAVARNWVHFPFLSDALGRLPFAIGWKLRRAIYAHILPGIGQQVVIHPGVVLEDPRTSIGDDVWISHSCYIDYAIVGDHVLVGPHAVILAGGRQHRSERLDIPIKQQGNNAKEPLTLGNGCWIGANATVMADVGHDAIVGAGAVVTHPVAPYAVVAGNPARVLRIRTYGGRMSR
jgi:acetyltransferase-like isoleucine patch superfamily enzyme